MDRKRKREISSRIFCFFLIEFIDAIPKVWERTAYVDADYKSPKRENLVFTTKETMSCIVKLYKMYQLFEKLEEESSDNIIFAIDSIATNEYYKLPETLLKKENNLFLCVEGVRAMEFLLGLFFASL